MIDSDEEDRDEASKRARLWVSGIDSFLTTRSMIFDLETLFGPEVFWPRMISISLSDEVDERSFSKRRGSLLPLWLSSLKLCTCVGGDRRLESDRFELKLESESRFHAE